MSDSTPPSHRCPTCNSSSMNARNLAVFIDGTSNQPGDGRSNVVKLWDLVFEEEHLGVEQHKFYLEGIGVHDSNSPSLTHAGELIHSCLEMAFAWNVEDNVKKAYVWLAKNYRKGDKIYLFGFSRGAFQVWTLASMVHEIGLVEETKQERVEQAYRHYHSINPRNPNTKKAAIKFATKYCRQGVKIHFVGVWDTVSSLGIIKKDVPIAVSASVATACHFRHALALDERRVKFMPEYVKKVKRLPSHVESGNPFVGDVQEVWFAGCHGDVGGVSRSHGPGSRSVGENVHAGNVPLEWMRQEAAAQGLVFKPETVPWCQEDVEFGREESMNFVWKLLEYFPVRQQVSRTGKHEWRLHLSRPRQVIPGQQIHSSVLSGKVYTPRATLGHRISIPVARRMISDDSELWTPNSPDKGATARLLASLLSDQEKTLESLNRASFLLDAWLDNGASEPIPNPQWLEKSICEPSGPHKFALIVIYDAISDSRTPEKLVRDIEGTLSTLLFSPDHSDFPEVLHFVRFSAKHRTLRQRFLTSEAVIEALVFALEWTARVHNGDLFPLVMDSVCYLIDDVDQRNCVINQLITVSHETEVGETRLSLVLQVKERNHLVAALKMVTSLAQHHQVHCQHVRRKVIDLARNTRGRVGSAAVETLIALTMPVPHDIPFSNVLRYLANTLPSQDGEITSSLPLILRVNSSGRLNEVAMHKLMGKLHDTGECTMATLVLLKLCNHSIVREFCSRNKVLDVFLEQLKRKETSLLAAHALATCLKHDMLRSDDFLRMAHPIVAMFDGDWFDGRVGWIEGSEIFEDLMTSGELRRRVIDLGMTTILMKKIECGEHRDFPLGHMYVEILGRDNPEELTRIVDDTFHLLRTKNQEDQKRGVKMLSFLAHTEHGEQALQPRVSDVMKMLLTPSDGLHTSCSQLLDACGVVYNLCHNETLRKQIRESKEFTEFQRLRSHHFQSPKVQGTWKAIQKLLIPRIVAGTNITQSG